MKIMKIKIDNEIDFYDKCVKFVNIIGKIIEILEI